jgi:hypothetical protein
MIARIWRTQHANVDGLGMREPRVPHARVRAFASSDTTAVISSDIEVIGMKPSA